MRKLLRRRRHRGRRRRCESGLTTIETLISMGVVLVASLSVATSTTTSFHAVDRAEHSANLENALRETVETVQAIDYANLETLDGNELYAADQRRSVIVQMAVTQVSPRLKAVRIDLFDKERNGSTWVAGNKITHAIVYRALR